MSVSKILKTEKLGSLRIIITIAIIVILATIPFLISAYELRTITFIFMWIALASNWNIIGGYIGYVDFGHIVWWGLGAYGVGIGIVEFGLPFWMSLIISVIVCAIIATIVSSVTLRLRGHFFAIAHLALLAGTMELILFLKPITHGGEGLVLPTAPNYTTTYFFMGAIAFICIFVSYLIINSKLGYSLRSIREDEDAAEAMGVNTHIQKMKAFVTAATLTAIVGGVYAYWIGYLVPDAIFSIAKTIQMIVMTLLGGIGLLLGPVLGATLLQEIETYLWAKFAYLHATLMGVILVLIILFLPQGVLGAIQEHAYSAKKLFKKLVMGE